MSLLIDPTGLEARRLIKHLKERETVHLEVLVATDDATLSAKLRGAIAEVRELLRQIEPATAE